MAHTDHDVHHETAPQLNEGSSGLERAPQPYWQSPCGRVVLVAALERGRRAIGIDISAEALGIARSRCEAVLGQASLFGGTGT